MQTNNHRTSPLGNSNHANDEYDFDEDDDNMSVHDSEDSDEGSIFLNLNSLLK